MQETVDAIIRKTAEWVPYHFFFGAHLSDVLSAPLIPDLRGGMPLEAFRGKYEYADKSDETP